MTTVYLGCVSQEEEGRLPDPPVGPKLSAPLRAVVGPAAGATLPTVETSAEMYNALNSRLEQLLTLNTQVQITRPSLTS